MSSGVTAGLHKGEVIRQQAEEKLRIERERLNKLDPKDLGKDESTVFRDRRGMKGEGVCTCTCQCADISTGRRLQGLEQFLRQQDGKFTTTEEDGTLSAKPINALFSTILLCYESFRLLLHRYGMGKGEGTKTRERE